MKRTILLSALLMIGSLAFAQRGGGKMEKRQFEGRFDKSQKGWMIQRLDLSEAQQAQMKELRLEHLEKIAATKNQLTVKRAALNAAIEVDKPDKKQIDQLVSEVNNLRGDLFIERTSHRLKVRTLLNEEQRLVFDQMDDRKAKYRRNGHRG